MEKASEGYIAAMSETSTTTTAYREEAAAARAISTSQLMGQVLFLVAIALAFCAAGTLIGKDLELGTARLFSFAGFGMLLLSSFGGERFRVGSFAMGWLFATALAIGVGLGPVIGYFATVETAALTPVALLVFAACCGTIVLTLFGGEISPWISLAIYGLSALLIVIDFNYLRKHGTERDTIWLATGIFVSIVNIFISLLNIFSSD
jgi:modulator of FtsH protease